MKIHVPIFFIAAIILLNSCAERTTDIMGQVFEVTKDRTNVKMGLVPVHVIPDEQFRAIAITVAAEMQASLQAEIDEAAIKEFFLELKLIKYVSTQAFRSSVSEFVRDENIKLGPKMTFDQAKKLLVDALPEPVSVTDADGKFKVTISNGVRFWSVAYAERQELESREGYLWIKPVEFSERPDLVLLSNNSNVDSFDALRNLLSSFDQNQSPTKAKVTPELAQRIEEVKAKAYSENAKAAEVQVSEAKAEAAKADAAGVEAAKVEAARVEAEKLFNLRKYLKQNEYLNFLRMKFILVPGTDVLFCEHETRVKDYAVYAAETPGVDMGWKDYEYYGHKQTPDHPVVNVNWEDAKAFCKWLSAKEGKSYRLPTDHEWSVAIGIGRQENSGTSPKNKNGKIEGFPWGPSCPPPRGAGNFKGSETDSSGRIAGYQDDHPFTAPVKSYGVGKHGLYDLSGNVYEWCDDSYSNRQVLRVLRGGSWSDSCEYNLRSSYRDFETPLRRRASGGFRCVVENLEEAAATVVRAKQEELGAKGVPADEPNLKPLRVLKGDVSKPGKFFPAPGPGDPPLMNTQDLVDAFLRAPSWKERIPYIYEGNRLKAMIQEYYKKWPDFSIDRFKIKLFQMELEKEYGGPFWVYQITYSEVARSGVPLIIQVEDGNLKVNWEVFSECNDEHFVKFREGKIKGPHDFRLVAERVTEYPGRDKDILEEIGDYRCYELNPPYGGYRVFSEYAFVKKGTPVARQLDAKIRLGEDPLAVTVTLERKLFANGTKRLVITKFVSEGWFK
ncbi:MAG: SUMF1/EgtB/PvdO family nonheme iron enzyme [Verrucomicrobiales bacterium]|nr:SUMF1/EgtB/PvdO family nonheme iron enzyme [Verrucomicrobiales bacterium]